MPGFRFLAAVLSGVLVTLCACPAIADAAPAAPMVAQPEPLKPEPLKPEPLKPEPLKIVYHVGDGIDQAARVIANIRNQLRISPDIRIVVVAIGPGIDFMLDGAKDKNGNLFDATVEDLTSQGVSFRICGNTMETRHIAPDAILPEVQVVPSGMNEIARLQLREHYAYIRP